MVASPAIPVPHDAPVPATLPPDHGTADHGTAVALRSPTGPDRAPFWQGAGWLARLWRPNRRVAPRCGALTGTVRVNGSALLLADLSRGGMKLIGYRGMLDRQDRFDFTLHALFDRAAPDGGELMLELSGEAIVAWRRGDRMGAAFYRLDPDHRTRLTHLLSVMAARLEA